MFNLFTFVSSIREKIPSFLSFLPASITRFIQKNIILSFLLCVSCIFVIEFFVTPVYIQGDSDAYNMQVFEWWPDLTKKITYFWLLSENKIRKFLGVPQPIKKDIDEKQKSSLGILPADISSIGDIWIYSKYLVFLKILTVILTLLTAYYIGTRWWIIIAVLGILASFGEFFFKSIVWDSAVLDSNPHDIIDMRYNWDHVLMDNILFSERILSIILILMLLAGIYYFFHSFKKKTEQ